MMRVRWYRLTCIFRMQKADVYVKCERIIQKDITIRISKFVDLWLNLAYNLDTRLYTVDGGIAL